MANQFSAARSFHSVTLSKLAFPKTELAGHVAEVMLVVKVASWAVEKKGCWLRKLVTALMKSRTALVDSMVLVPLGVRPGSTD